MFVSNQPTKLFSQHHRFVIWDGQQTRLEFCDQSIAINVCHILLLFLKYFQNYLVYY